MAHTQIGVPMRTRNPQLPELVDCGNPKCGRLLKLDEYRSTGITAKERNTINVTSPLLAGLGVFCTCGYYTQFVEPRK
ncbi:hypothetical protein PSAC2689_20516 [Paraburkholderia sacchari]